MSKAFLHTERECAKALRIVSEVCGVSRAQLVGPRVLPTLVFARLLFYFVCREYLGASSPLIGRIIKRDHSTVLYGARTVLTRIGHHDAHTVNTLHIIRARLGLDTPTMSRQTKTVITCSRCKKNTLQDGMEGLIERYVLHESYPTGNVQLESLESMQGRIAEGMRTSNDAVKNTLAPYIAADMCTRCVETVQLVLDVPKILDGPKDNNIIRDDTEHFIGGYPEDNVR